MGVVLTSSSDLNTPNIDAILLEPGAWVAVSRAELLGVKDEVQTRLRQVLAQPKPNYSIRNESVGWATYVDILMKALAAINTQLLELDEVEMQRSYFRVTQHTFGNY